MTTTSQALYQAAMMMLEEVNPGRASHRHLSQVWRVSRPNLYLYARGETSPSAGTIGKWLQRWEQHGYPPLAVVIAGGKCWAGPAASLPPFPSQEPE